MRQLFLVLVCLTRVFAVVPPPPGEEIASPIAKGAHVTYAELLGEICTELKVAGDAPASATTSATLPIRSLGSAAEPETMEGGVEVGSVHTVPLTASGSPRALISFAMSGDAQWFRYFALFDLSATPKLLDVVQVPGFPDDEGDYAKSLPLGSAASAWIFDAWHSNSQQGYQMSTIVCLHGSRFDMMAQVGLLSCTGCGSGTFKESLIITTAADPASDIRQVAIRVRRTGGHPGTFAATYRWDKAAGKFVTASHELERLDEFNQKNY